MILFQKTYNMHTYLIHSDIAWCEELYLNVYILILLIYLATSVTCEEEDGHISYHPDKADCTMYYMCEGERKHHMPCPSNLVFNPKENVCDWPENVEGCMQHTPAPPTSRR